MAAPSGNQYAVGLRHARVYAQTSYGVPAATSKTVYEGIQLTGAKAYELTIPDVRRIAHVGDDSVLMQDVLPRQEVSSGTLRVAMANYDAFAILTGTKKATLGEAVSIGYGTNQQGNEPSVTALLYQQSKAAESGVRTYRYYLLPSTQCIINPAGLSENAPEFTVSLLPSSATKYPWGVAFTANTEGFTRAEFLEGEVVGKPHIAAWCQDGTETEWVFHADRPAVATAKIHVITVTTTAGVTTDVTGSATKATDKITISPAIAAGSIVTCFYEY